MAKQLIGILILSCLMVVGAVTIPTSAQAAITLQCVNSSGGTTWNLEVDYDRRIVDSFPAEVTADQVSWRDTSRGGYYSLDRTSGALTFRNASSTGGYFLYHTCKVR
jgi:hypothetical protein